MSLRLHWPPAVVVFSFAVLTASAWAGDISRASVVRFYTVCATCHEAECSGRLSFRSGAAAAQGHMERYLGPLAATDVEELFALLRHTKERCSRYPLSASLPPDRRWQAGDLAGWREARGTGYFLPLGELAPGLYRLQLAFAANAQGRLKISGERTDPLADEALCPQQQADIAFEVTDRGAHYLTVTGQSQLVEVTLHPAGR
jgi:hypothetical protein